MSEKKFTLADAMRDTIGSASVANMGAAASVNAERTIENITSEILHYQAVGGDAVVQIGKRLIEAKEMLPHGGWLPWLSEQVNYSERTAQRLMKIARECSNPTALSDLGATKALALLALPSEERDELLNTYDVPNMSTRELEQAIKERDEARAEREKESERADAAEALRDNAEKQAQMLRESADKENERANAAERRIKELENAPKEVYRDEDAIKAAAENGLQAGRTAAAAEWSAKVADAEAKTKELQDKLAKAEEKAKKAAEKAKNAGADSGAEAEKYKAEADRLRAELEKARRESAKASISGDADLAAFQLLFEQVQTDVNKMRGLLLKVRGREDSDLGAKLAKALLALADAVKESAA